jgi:isovaleryl-CoA dehydrogenase
MSFGKPLGEFGQIQRFIGEGYANMSAGRALLYATAASMDLGVCVTHTRTHTPDAEPSSNNHKRLETDAVKLFCGKMAKDVADAAMQSLGGYGYVADYQVVPGARNSYA